MLITRDFVKKKVGYRWDTSASSLIFWPFVTILILITIGYLLYDIHFIDWPSLFHHINNPSYIIPATENEAWVLNTVTVYIIKLYHVVIILFYWILRISNYSYYMLTIVFMFFMSSTYLLIVYGNISYPMAAQPIDSK